MRKILILGVAIVALIVLTSLTYTYINNYNERKEAELHYRTALKKIYSKDNPYYPEAQIAYYDSLELSPSNNVRQAMVLQLLKSTALLNVGQERLAVQALEGLEQMTHNDGRDQLAMDIKRQLALAYLRLGERSNCMANHSAASCIFPIAGSGIYVDPSASWRGIQTYQQILAIDTGDLESRWLLNIAYMTIGEYPAKVPARWLIPGLDEDTSAYKLKPFRDISHDLRLNGFRSEAGGAIVEDFNGDGYYDIVTSSWDLDQSMHYFRNNGDGSFTDLSVPSGLSNIKGGLNLIQADYNNDGFTDILVLRGAWMGEFGLQPKTLLRNNGDGTFTDVTVESGILSFSPTQTGVWADFNNDGWVDLFIGNETLTKEHPHPSELYINNHDGTFTNVAAEAGCERLGFMKGVTAGDYDRDGWPDLFISCRDGKKILLRNCGTKGRIPNFEDMTKAAHLDSTRTYTFPTWFWDYNNDGWPDIFVCGYQYPGSIAAIAAADALHRPMPLNTGRMYLYRNNHDGTFTDVAPAMGLDRPVFAMGSNFGDVDNDGWLDMYLGTGNPDYSTLIPNRLFKNIEGKKFVDVTGSARVGNLQKGHGVAFADIDNDGDQDIFIELGGALKGDGYYNSLYQNPGQGQNNWISVLLEGTKSNRSAIGAHISVSFKEDGVERTVYMDVNSGGSFGCSPFRKEIGIGRGEMIDDLTIQWPTSGIVQHFKNIVPRQFLQIKEGVDQLEKVKLNPLTFKSTDGLIRMVDCMPTK